MNFRHAVFAASLLSVVACNDQLTAPVIEDTTFAASLGVDLAASTKTANGLYYRDLLVGTGAGVVNGQRLTVKYTGSLRNGTVFDSNVTGTPFSFALGTRQVIEGWDQGIVGMRVGGRRQLIIPPSLGYGATENGPIPANSILVFTVEILSAT